MCKGGRVADGGTERLSKLLNDGLPELDIDTDVQAVLNRELEGQGLALLKDENVALPVPPAPLTDIPPDAEAVIPPPTPPPPLAPLLAVGAAGENDALQLPPLEGDIPSVPESPPVELPPPLPVPLPLPQLDLDLEPLAEPDTALTPDGETLPHPLALGALELEGLEEERGDVESTPLEVALRLYCERDGQPLEETCRVSAGEGVNPEVTLALCDPDTVAAFVIGGICVEFAEPDALQDPEGFARVDEGEPVI